MLRLWAQSGLRAGEVLGLQWQDLDLERGTVLVQRSWSRQRIGPTKTGRARVVSALHPIAEASGEWRPGATVEARSILSGLRRLPVRSLDPATYIFARGERPLFSSDLHADWRRVLTRAKVRHRPPEQLRHTFASTMLSRNAPLLYVQQQGGWRSATVLLRVYARWLPQEAVALVVPERPAATLLQPGSEVVAVTR
jgi:integrase